VEGPRGPLGSGAAVPAASPDRPVFHRLRPYPCTAANWHSGPIPDVPARRSTRCASGLRTSAWRMIMRPCPAGRGNARGAQATAIGRSGSTSSPSVEAAPALIPRAMKSIRRFCRHRPAESHPGRNWRGRSPGTRLPRQSPQERPDARPALAPRAVAARRPLPPCLRCESVRD
jgi:hypothetical protein